MALYRKCFFRLVMYKIMVKVTFVGFMGAFAPIAPPSWVGMAIGESRGWRFVDVNDLISCDVYAQPLIV